MPSLSWLYVDLNSFFASCEQQENPELRGKPVAVVPLFADTTSCLAASYEAKRFGVKTGVKVGDAKRMCPGIKFVESRHDIYIQYHHRVKTAIETCVPIDGVLSVDEFAARLTGSQQNEEQAIHVAHQIKMALKRDIGDAVTASIGISVNRFLAKIATDMKKPDGLTVIKKSDLPTKLHSLALRDIPGIGVKTEERLGRQKIFTVQELLIQSKEKMNQLWGGIWGERMYYWLRGEEVDLPPSKTRSISHQHVLPPAERTQHAAYRIAQKLLVKLAIRLRRSGAFTRNLTLGVKFMNDYYWSNSTRFDELRDTHSLLHKLSFLWSEFPKLNAKPIRVDVSFSELIEQATHQFSFFENPKLDEISKAMDLINQKYGKEKVHLGATHDSNGSAPTRIAFRRIPELDEI